MAPVLIELADAQTAATCRRADAPIEHAVRLIRHCEGWRSISRGWARMNKKFEVGSLGNSLT